MLVQTQDEKLSDNSMHEAQFNGYSKQMWTKQFWCCVTSDHKITVHACTLVYIYTRTYPPVDGVDNTQVWRVKVGHQKTKFKELGDKNASAVSSTTWITKPTIIADVTITECRCLKAATKGIHNCCGFFIKKNALQIVRGPTRHYTQFAPLTNISYSGHQAYGCWSIAT